MNMDRNGMNDEWPMMQNERRKTRDPLYASIISKGIKGGDDKER